MFPKKKDQKSVDDIDKELKEQLAAKLDKFLLDNHIKLSPSISFPTYNKMPDDLKLALLVIQKHEPAFGIEVVLDNPSNPVQ